MISQDQIDEEEEELGGKKIRGRGSWKKVRTLKQEEQRQKEKEEIHEINPDQLVWRKITHSIFNFPSNSFVCTFPLLINQLKCPKILKGVHYGD